MAGLKERQWPAQSAERAVCAAQVAAGGSVAVVAPAERSAARPPSFTPSSFAAVEWFGGIFAGEVALMRVGGPRSAAARLWKQMVAAHHYLSYQPACGAQVRYLIGCADGVIGALSFSAAAWRLAARDQGIGWSESARRAHLQQVVANDRFLIVPSVRVKNLASRVLALAAQRLPTDWQARYGYRPLLLEAFVETGRFKGTCYRAANWVEAGTTAGRSRQDWRPPASVPRKTILLLPLVAEVRPLLCEAPPPLARLAVPAEPMRNPPSDWAQAEFGHTTLGDARLQRRLWTVTRDLFARPGASLPQACGSRAKTKAAYRLFAHPTLQLDPVLASHYTATHTRLTAQAIVMNLLRRDKACKRSVKGKLLRAAFGPNSLKLILSS